MAEQRKPFVKVTPHGPDDGGDFGPNTPDSRTAGIREAIDYAHEHLLDVYIHGGRGGMHEKKGLPVTYVIRETLHIPWAQDFRLDGTNYTLAGAGGGPILHIDSQMNCKYRFGMILGSGTSGQPAVLVKPEAKGPDDMAVIVASEFEFAAVCGYDGLVFDATNSGIGNNTFFAEETNTMRYGVHMRDTGAGHGMTNNIVEVMYTNQYHATGDAVGFRIGDPGSRHARYNTFRSSLGAPLGVVYDEPSGKFISPEGFETPDKAMGLQIYGQGNRFDMLFNGTRYPGKDVVFEPESRDNTVYAFNLPNGYTNNADAPTNRILPSGPVGFSEETPPFPTSGESVTNRTPYLIEAFILTAGDVSEWTIVDANGGDQVFKGGLMAGQSFLMEPGDQVSFRHTTTNSHDAPSWRWKALR